jgi:hypothetical protein
MDSAQNVFVTAQNETQPVVRGCDWCKRRIKGKRPDAKYCSDACRMAAYRSRHDPAGAPYRPDLRPRASGRQVSYRKAVDVVEAVLVECGHPRSDATRVLAERWMRDALPERQRARARVTDA